MTVQMQVWGGCQEGTCLQVQVWGDRRVNDGADAGVGWQQEGT